VRVVKARYELGSIDVPLNERPASPCEVLVIFPDDEPEAEEERRKRFRAAAGGWRDMDTDKLIADIYAARGHASPEGEHGE